MLLNSWLLVDLIIIALWTIRTYRFLGYLVKHALLGSAGQLDLFIVLIPYTVAFRKLTKSKARILRVLELF